MARLPILEVPDPRLRMMSVPVTAFDASLLSLVENLAETLYATQGIGISAPQIGALQRVVVLDLSERCEPPQIYINPELLDSSTPGLIEESCLSVPGIKGNVFRHTEIRLRAVNTDGRSFERKLSAMNAVAMLHELDHLDGRLFVDKLTWIGKLRLRFKRRQEEKALA